MTRAICFDFDGTLAHYTGDFAAFVAGLRAELSLTQCDMRGFGESLSQHLRAEGAVTLRSALEATLAGLEQRPPPDIEEVATRAVAAYAATARVATSSMSGGGRCSSPARVASRALRSVTAPSARRCCDRLSPKPRMSHCVKLSSARSPATKAAKSPV